MQTLFRLEKLPRTTGGIKYTSRSGWSIYVPQDKIRELTPMGIIPEVIAIDLRVADPLEIKYDNRLEASQS